MENQMIDEVARQERLEYYRKWRATHKENIRQHNQNYWKHRAERKLEKEKFEHDEQ